MAATITPAAIRSDSNPPAAGVGPAVSAAGISLPVTEWEDAQVSSWLSSLNLSSLATSFKEQGIQGDVLVQLDNEALKDLGVDSVGQRLTLLGGIYKLKELWGIDIDQGDYRPQSEDIAQNSSSSSSLPSAAPTNSIPHAYSQQGGSVGKSSSLYSVSEPPVTVAQLVASLRQRDDRIVRLEQELRRATVFLAKFQYDFTGVCRYQGLRAPTIDFAFQPFTPGAPIATFPGRKSSAGFPASVAAASNTSLTSPASHHGHFLHSPAGSMASLPKNAMQPPGSAGLQPSYENPYNQQQQHQAAHQPYPYNSQTLSSVRSVSNEETEERIRTPTSAGGTLEPPSPGFAGSSAHMDGVSHAPDSYGPGSRIDPASLGGLSPLKQSSASVSTPVSATFPPWVRPDRAGPPPGSVTPAGSYPYSSQGSHGRSSGNASGIRGTPASPRHLGPSNGGPATSPTQTTSARALQAIQQQQHGTPSSSTSKETSATNAQASSSSQRDRDFVGTATTLGTGDNPYKSFRVTLEDPCYKVLPAALKKYKINDDWRLYALFICYGTTERCLSYDEKPLLLFQKLKEARQNPVFMLRHIRDVKSPISIANAKAAARRGSAASTGRKDSTAGVGSSSSNKPPATRLVPASDAATLGSSAAAAVSNSTGSHNSKANILLSGPAAALPRAAPDSRTYAIAIYPYVCERDDEFDVNVGDTFVVLSKAKGWWVVQRDSGASGGGDVMVPPTTSISAAREESSTAASSDPPIAEVKSGWVPAGCLIETSQPLAPFFGASPDDQVGESNCTAQRAGETVDDEAATPTPSSNSGTGEGFGKAGRSVASPSHSAFSSQQKQKSVALDQTKAPIPPQLIISTSTPGIMLMDYSSAVTAAATAAGASTGNKSSSASGSSSGTSASISAELGSAALDLKKDDRMRVFKRYNHWSYCVQEGGNHARGWVPSWYIGKISSRSQQLAATQATTPAETVGSGEATSASGSVGGGVSSGTAGHSATASDTTASASLAGASQIDGHAKGSSAHHGSDAGDEQRHRAGTFAGSAADGQLSTSSSTAASPTKGAYSSRASGET
ncbi:unnamed protein product [Parajaminaea phylloscopi]